MPWAEMSVVSQRYQVVQMVRSGIWTVSEAAARKSVSRKTVYKWLHRFDEGGVEALQDRPRAPHHSPSNSGAILRTPAPPRLGCRQAAQARRRAGSRASLAVGEHNPSSAERGKAGVPAAPASSPPGTAAAADGGDRYSQRALDGGLQGRISSREPTAVLPADDAGLRQPVLVEVPRTEWRERRAGSTGDGRPLPRSRPARRNSVRWGPAIRRPGAVQAESIVGVVAQARYSGLPDSSRFASGQRAP